MRRMLHALALLLGLTLLAAEPASAAWSPGQKVASGSAEVVELLASENARLSAERAGENVALSYESASGSPVAARGTAQSLRSFTQGNFRENLRRLTGGIPDGAHAHHMFPQKFAAQFERAGINIHDPKFGAWWQGGAHQSAAGAYNQAWQQFFRGNPGASADDIMQYGRDLAGRYGLTIGF